MNDDAAENFSVKELLVELRRDVRAIGATLDQKADREAVHKIISDVAALKAFQAVAMQFFLEYQETQKEVKDLRAWRYRLTGAIIALAGVITIINVVQSVIWHG